MSKEKLEFPLNFLKLIGTQQKYVFKKSTIIGTVEGLRWSFAQIMNIKTMERWYGIELRIKPNNGKKARWTKPFNSGIKINEKI